VTATEEKPSPTRLIPDERIQWSDPFPIDLGDLPKNDRLIGPGPDKAFLDNLEALGQLEPIQVVAEGEGWLVLGGRRRIKAFRVLHGRNEASGDWRYIRAVTPKEGSKGAHSAMALVTLDIASNANRRDNPLSDLVGIRRMLEEFGCTPDKPTHDALTAISKATGLGYAKVVQRLKLVRLEPRILKEASEGRLKVNVAEAIAKLDLTLQKELADAMDDGEALTMKAVHEATRAGSVVAATKIQQTIGGLPERKALTVTEATSVMLRAALDAAAEGGARRLGPGTIVLADGTRWKVALEVTPEREEATDAQGGDAVPAGGAAGGGAKPRVRKPKGQGSGAE
jgi:hypothetical protein